MSTTVAEPTIAERVERLRSLMAAEGLAVYIVPSPDPHQSEYVPSTWRRREWISGFSGSAGTVVVTRDAAFVWADSRYWLQAERQLGEGPFTLMRMGDPSVPLPIEWLEANLGEGERVGVDPQVVTQKLWDDWSPRLDRIGGKLVACEPNLVDRIWERRPSMPVAPLKVLALEYTGASVADKLASLRAELKSARAVAHVVSTLDAIAWLTNLRGRDVDHNPVAISYLIVGAKGAQLFIDANKVTDEVRKHLSGQVELRPYEDFSARLADIAATGGKIWVDPGTISRWIVERIIEAGGSLIEKQSPITLAKAIKNPTELAGMRDCHIRDGAAVTRFLRWLQVAITAGERVDEISAADRLAAFRGEGERFQGLSFSTISGFGPNGAIVHYSATPESALRLSAPGVYLVDSGGQYLDGTTDITRTVALGAVGKEEKQHFTLVLKGHIAIATARFPAGSTGAQLDTLARKPLWDEGLNYGHGTGHGVGHFLCVHEGPQGIAPGANAAKLEPGMILSNEPGYYRSGRYGIRIESLVEVVDRGAGADGGSFLGFETLTMAPIDKAMIDISMLTEDERAWLDGYHATVRAQVTPLLDDPADRAWLERETSPLS